MQSWRSHPAEPKENPVIYEILTQRVEPEKRDEYIRVFGDVLKKANYAGSHGIKFFTSIEEPSQIIVMIEWDSVEAHTQHRGTPTHNAMRSTIRVSISSTSRTVGKTTFAGSTKVAWTNCSNACFLNRCS